jgi:arabinose-5-phosphate isomerase
LITISRDDKGPMPQNADVALTLGESNEACPLGLHQPQVPLRHWFG